MDECHRSGFGDWFGILEYFGSAFQLGLTATPREFHDVDGRELSDEEERRDTYNYFGDPAYTYSLKQAVEDGYLVPYLLEQRVTNIDAEGFTGPDGKEYTTESFEREIRLPERTTFLAEDLYAQLGQQDLLRGKGNRLLRRRHPRSFVRAGASPDFGRSRLRSANHSFGAQ